MGMPWGDIIGAAASIGTGLLSQKGAEERNVAQIAASREQMAFQERMSNTAHQREIKDLRLAGLNPILSAKYGGASTPSGAQPNIEDEIAPAIASAQQARRLHVEIANVREETKVKKETQKTQRAEQKLKESQFYQTEVDAMLKLRQAKFVDSNTALNILQQKAAVYKLPQLKKEAQMYEGKYGELLRWAEKLNPLTGSAKSLGLSTPRTHIIR